MSADDQAAVIAYLASPAAFGTAVERIETHASIVFLAGDRAWKLKRAVKYDYLDFSTPERRHQLCEAELRINRRTAPGLYRRVVPVTRDASGALAVDGSGPAVDWLLEMSRFDQSQLFDRLAASGQLPLELMAPLGVAIARLHRSADPRRDHGGVAGMAWVVDGNESAFAAQTDVIDAALAAAVTAAARAAIARHAVLLDSRRERGAVRQGHGDLHLRNIVLLDEVPTLFDAVEFNDEIGCIDVWYDIAFLLMDLWRRRLPGHANAVLNAYLKASADVEGLALLPLFLSCRAAVRAKTSASSAALQTDPARREELRAQARGYLDAARALLQPPPPCAIAVGGLSGSGKSALALRIAGGIGPVPGAVVVRSDEVRKRLAGVAPTDPLGPSAYTDAFSRRVYAQIADTVRLVLRTGHAVIVDAVFAHPGDRAAIEAAARDEGAPWAGLWLEAPEALRIERVESRRGDPSDADARVIRMQRDRDLGALDWQPLDASQRLDALAGEAIARLRQRWPDRVREDAAR